MITHFCVRHCAKVSKLALGVCLVHPANIMAANIRITAIFFILLYIRGKIRHKNLLGIFDVVSIYSYIDKSFSMVMFCLGLSIEKIYIILFLIFDVSN